ncbi:MAG: rRNA maturation RNase YbeY [Deltaproteobacteria bacterium]|nr:rRNA maturation RNase YbeY [Deltaproteobacteria bacterium]
MKVEIRDSSGTEIQRRKIKEILKAILKDLGLSGCEVSIVLTDNPGMKELNRKYRRINKPTDVLSFPMESPPALPFKKGAAPRDIMLGDIVISTEKAREQAKEYGAGFYEEMTRLLIHGVLHLIGYDHVKGGSRAKRMKEKEEGLLKAVRVGLEGGTRISHSLRLGIQEGNDK